MKDVIPEAHLRAAAVLHELYAGLPAERTARAYVLVTEEAERAANDLIKGWLSTAFQDGYHTAREVQAQQEEAETRAFLEQARTVTRIVEVGTAREEEAQKRGEGESYPGGPVPVWCGPLCQGVCAREAGDGPCPYRDLGSKG